MHKSIDLLIYGMGGHAQVVWESAERLPGVRVVGFLSDSEKDLEAEIAGQSCLGSAEGTKVPKPSQFIVAIGSSNARRSIAERMNDRGHLAFNVIDKEARVSSSACISEGSYIGIGAVVNARAWVGKHTIINTGAIVEHDCHIGDYVHISPSATLGGNVNVGEGSWVGLGANIRNGINIGKNCIVGVGAAVVKDVPDGWTVTGVPATRLV